MNNEQTRQCCDELADELSYKLRAEELIKTMRCLMPARRQQEKFRFRRITGYVSTTRYLITADYGFTYKRNKLLESDKIVIDKKTIPFVNKRYLLTLEEI